MRLECKLQDLLKSSLFEKMQSATNTEKLSTTVHVATNVANIAYEAGGCEMEGYLSRRLFHEKKTRGLTEFQQLTDSGGSTAAAKFIPKFSTMYTRANSKCPPGLIHFASHRTYVIVITWCFRNTNN